MISAARLLVEDVEHVRLRREGRAREGQVDEEHDERQEDPEPPDLVQRAGPRAPAGEAAASIGRIDGGRPAPVSGFMPPAWVDCRRRPPGSPTRRAHRRRTRPRSARPHDGHAMGEPDDLLELRGDQQDAESLLGQADEQLVDRAFRSDVDAARRLVGDDELQAGTTASVRGAPSAGSRRTAPGRAGCCSEHGRRSASGSPP